MAGSHHMLRGMLQVRPDLLGHVGGEIRIGLSPDQLERNIKRLQLGQAIGVAGEFLEELRRICTKAGPELGCCMKLSAMSG